MQTTATSPEEYLNGLPEDKKEAMHTLRSCLLSSLPAGFEENMRWGMISYEAPHALYPKGYHVNPKLPLPFISIASQKNFVALYHMGLFANDALLQWFKEAYGQHCNTKLDMGKSCIRFKKWNQLPLALIGALAAKLNPHEWIELYEATMMKRGT